MADEEQAKGRTQKQSETSNKAIFTVDKAIIKQAEVLQYIRKLQEDNDGRKASNQREPRQYVLKGLN